MTISAFHVDSVISAYAKQSKIKMRQSFLQDEGKSIKHEDVVSLSQQAIDKAEAYKKISSSVIDAIVKAK